MTVNSVKDITNQTLTHEALPGYDIIETCDALKRMRRAYNVIRPVWGTTDFIEVVDSMVLVEPGGRRDGFPLDVMSDLLKLRKAFEDNPRGCSHPNNTTEQTNSIVRSLDRCAWTFA